CRFSNRADRKLYAFSHAVQARVRACDLNRFSVRVAGCDARVRRELGGGDGQYACARADIEKAVAVKMSLKRGEAQARRLVRARAEGHARLDAYNDPPGTVL